METIEKILMGIEIGCFFDSHYVTETLISNFSDEYLKIAHGLGPTNNLTLRLHQKIGNLISSFEDKLVERQPMQSWSLNIHSNASSCALWKRI